MTPPATAARKLFSDILGGEPEVIVRSPGRVNLIGDHTDYNDGFVMPMAIDRSLRIALRTRQDGRVRVYSQAYDEWTRFDASTPTTQDGWRAYIEGVASELGAAGLDVQGWEGVVVSSIPSGAGLSSSAALEMASARAFVEASQSRWDPIEMAELGRRAENDWVGVKCGIMDQLSSAMGRRGHAMLIDCRSLDIRHVPIPHGAAVIVLDTGTRRDLRDSAYNDRRAACEAAAQALSVPALRDVDASDLDRAGEILDDELLRRVRHVVRENQATVMLADAFDREDIAEAGRLMSASHSSLRDDFEVSSVPLDAMVEVAISTEGCLGARMTGGGFGGSAVALVDRDATEVFTDEALTRYRQRSGLEGSALLAEAVDGTTREFPA